MANRANGAGLEMTGDTSGSVGTGPSGEHQCDANRTLLRR